MVGMRKYIEYIKRYSKEYDLQYLIYLIEKFYILHKKKLHFEDIYRYKPNDLYYFLNSFNDVKTKTDLYKECKKGVQIIFEDDSIKLIKIKNKSEMELYGLDSRWCVSMKSDDTYFNDYKLTSNIYVLLYKKFKLKVDMNIKLPDDNKWIIEYFKTYYDHATKYKKSIECYKFIFLKSKIDGEFRIFDQLNIQISGFDSIINIINKHKN
jgi:hypothetical protein